MMKIMKAKLMAKTIKIKLIFDAVMENAMILAFLLRYIANHVINPVTLTITIIKRKNVNNVLKKHG
jgi:hypothetical protein